MRFALVAMALILAGNLSAQVVDRNPSNVISTAKKLIIVTTPDWKSVGGTMLRYERRKNTWKQVGTPIDVVVGRNGMAWDPSLTAELKKYPDWIKREGDGRSPAGFFRIARKFGFAPKISKNDFYLPITPTTECVDDVNSKYYNQIVDRLELRPEEVDWNSSEKMRQVEGYRTGAEVEYNQQPTVAGRGSCIFLHIWSGRGIGTAGCTAMSEEDAMLVMQWIDDRTVLVQLPQRDYEGMKGAYKLP